MRRGVTLFAACLGCLTMAASPTVADINPVASRGWVTDGEVRDVAVADDTAYLTGTFQWIGRRSSSGESMLDATTGAVLQGCARSTGYQGGLRPSVTDDAAGGLFMRIPYLPPPHTAGQLADGDGVFAVPAGRSFVRVRPDCRFDRTFQLAEFIPGDSATGGLTIAHRGALLYVGGARPTSPTTESIGRVALFNASTGALVAARDFPEFGVAFVEGVAPDGRAVVVGRLRNVVETNPNMVAALVDLASGVVTPLTSPTTLLFSKLIGTTLYLRPATGTSLLAFDVVAGLPKAGWANPALFVTDIEAFAGRLFVATGTPSSGSLVVLSETTGVVDPTWISPPLTLASAGSGVQRLGLSGSRLYARGPAARAVGGSERFQLFAIDAISGAVDSQWVPMVFAPTQLDVDVVAFGGGVFVGALESELATTRRNLAAVSLSTGAILPFDPNATGSLTPIPAMGVDRVAVNSTSVFTASGNMVRAVSRTSGAIESWTVLAGAVGLTSPNAAVSALVATDSAVYVGGYFSRLQGAAPVPTQVRGHAGAFDSVASQCRWERPGE